MRVFVTSGARTGSVWLCRVLSTILGYDGTIDGAVPHTQFPERDWYRSGLPSKFSFIHGVGKVHHVQPSYIRRMFPADPIFYIDRDVRDQLVSYPFYVRGFLMQNWPDEVTERDKELIRSCDGLDDVAFVNRCIEECLHDFYPIMPCTEEFDGLTKLHYEDLVRHPVEQIQRMIDVLDSSADAEEVAELTKFKKSSHNRKGIIGDWKNYLNERSLEIIDERVEQLRKESPGFTFYRD